MQTVVKSPTKTVMIGPEHPFVIIGERINPTGRKALAAEMQAGDFSRVERDALRQVRAGAHILDVNAGVPSAEPEKIEPELMVKAVEVVQSVTDVPLCIDSSVVPALLAGLEAAKGRPIVNSVTGEEDRLESILPVVAEYNVPVIGICNDESGIGIKREDVILDPLAMPVGAINSAGIDLFMLVRMIREELDCNTVCGASNISFGLPNRRQVDSVFVPMAIGAGMTCAITNPIHKEVRNAVYAADMLMGHDESCMRYLSAMRDAETKAKGASDATAPPDRRSAREARRAARAKRSAS